MTHKLTAWEVEELLEQLRLRPALWMGKDLLWVRRTSRGNELALKFIRENTYLTLHTRALNPEIPQEQAERYTLWLLNKFTSYEKRMKIISLLRPEVGEEKAYDLARRICALEHDLTEQVQDSTEASAVTEAHPVVTVESTLTAASASTTAYLGDFAVQSVVKGTVRSKYLMRLLKQ